MLVAKRTVDGVAEGTRETGGNVVEAVRATVNAAAGGIGDIGTTAVTSVRDILMSIVGGVKDVAGAAMPKSYRVDDRTPPGEYTAPTDRTNPPEYVPPSGEQKADVTVIRARAPRVPQPRLYPSLYPGATEGVSSIAR